MKNSEKSNLYKLESDGTFAMKRRHFTNTALPVFSGAECWFQHFHIVQAIVKSNGWPEETAVLQLFAHLKGEALNVALVIGILPIPWQISSTEEAVRERVRPTGIGPSYVCN